MSKADVRLLVAASANPMGRQVFETLMLSAIEKSLTQQPGLNVETRHVRNLRSHAYGDLRVPFRLLETGGVGRARLIGDYLGGRARLVHRFDLRLPPRHGPEIATAHDLPPFRFDDEGELPPWFVPGQRRLLGMVVPSAFAADEMRELLGTQQVWVVPYGLAAYYTAPEPAPAEVLRSWGIDRPFVLHAAGATKRKNLPALKAAWIGLPADVRRAHQLVLAGPEDERRTRLFEDVEEALLVGRKEPRDVAGVMCHASAVVVPSLYEGFGLPALEGMACGVPVVASNVTALPQVCGEAALLVSPDPDGIGEGLLRVLEDEALADDLRLLGPGRASSFSWASAAESYVQIWKDLL